MFGNAGKDDATKLRILFFMLIHGFLNFTMIDPFRSPHTHTGPLIVLFFCGQSTGITLLGHMGYVLNMGD